MKYFNCNNIGHIASRCQNKNYKDSRDKPNKYHSKSHKKNYDVEEGVTDDDFVASEEEIMFISIK